jgi:hypothetical protein
MSCPTSELSGNLPRISRCLTLAVQSVLPPGLPDHPSFRGELSDRPMFGCN